MQIVIREIDQFNDGDYGLCDSSFLVTSKLILSAGNGKISCRTVNVSPYTKTYGRHRTDSAEYDDRSEKTVFFAYVNEEIAGQVRVEKYWNGYAYINDLVVDAKYRRQGVGRTLIEQVTGWAREKGFPGLMLETQNNNVGACKLYESCGFELCGFDTHLYKALNPASDEIALYWYLMF
jgi:ribosomal protein S18 acetylase RimI-like enzyme